MRTSPLAVFAASFALTAPAPVAQAAEPEVQPEGAKKEADVSVESAPAAEEAKSTPPLAKERGGVAGPDQVDNRMAADALAMPHFEIRALAPYHGMKKDLYEKTGLSYGVDYSVAGFGATQAVGASGTASGMVRLYGSWDAIDRGGPNQGGFVFKVEHRHRYSDLAPKDFGFNIGYVGLELPPFSDQGARLTNLYYRQTFFDKRIVFLAGYVDATDYVDVYALASPWMHFSNFAFSTGSGSLSVPNEGLGFALGAWLTDQFYVLGNLSDQNSNQARPWETFGRFFSEHQYFKSLEFGFTSGRDRAYLDNIHVTAWHADAKNVNGDPSGWGVNASGTWYLKDRWLPFLRGGFSQDAGTLYSGSVSLGVGHQWVPGQDVLGVGLNWSRPNASSFGPGLEDQFTGEVFYRWQVTKEIALTPDAQLLINPALNPDADVSFVGGGRLRIAL